MTYSLLIEELTRDEAMRVFAYDDATGNPITPGSTVKGHVTIGIGRALDVNGVTRTEALYLLENDINGVIAQLISFVPNFGTIDDVRQRVLTNMAFNMGVNALRGFHEMLRYIGEGRYDLAARAMEDSLWYRQVGDRAKRLVSMMRTGNVTTHT